jgi:hypothetical protein
MSDRLDGLDPLNDTVGADVYCKEPAPAEVPLASLKRILGTGRPNSTAFLDRAVSNRSWYPRDHDNADDR